MSIRNLEHLFQPGAVAMIGASDRPQSLGASLMGARAHIHDHRERRWRDLVFALELQPASPPARAPCPTDHATLT